MPAYYYDDTPDYIISRESELEQIIQNCYNTIDRLKKENESLKEEYNISSTAATEVGKDREKLIIINITLRQEIERLRTTLANRRSDNEGLVVRNNDLKEKIQSQTVELMVLRCEVRDIQIGADFWHKKYNKLLIDTYSNAFPNVKRK